MIYLLAAVFLILFAGSWIAAFAALAVLGLAGAADYHSHYSDAGTSALIGAIWHADGSWEVRASCGFRMSAFLQPSTFFHPLLVILHFRLENGKKRYMVLCRDTLQPETYRRLRARMRVEGLDSPEVDV